jgi:hypothetical protein
MEDTDLFERIIKNTDLHFKKQVFYIIKAHHSINDLVAFSDQQSYHLILNNISQDCKEQLKKFLLEEK